MSDQGKAYAAFVESELKCERDRRVHLDNRGAALVTTSSSLVALLAAVVAFFRVGTNLTFPNSALPTLIVAIAALALVAASGIIASWNHTYHAPSVGSLGAAVKDRWATDEETDARNYVAQMQIEIISSLRRSNASKAGWIRRGLVGQTIALLGLGIVVCQMLIGTM
ncbi:hypothetical protein [Micromonospora sp. NBC_01796]|uniref:hypothetical protein n=1 Tax=Micromonospora sp. NBC_01796 TaxID=2975987 RepID=UPI002DD7AE85|nr:hypothetical protein [Micromonospora sp. NBC_01796]WSA85171.1 hypothetical protein OIE47_33240 [Micromonospora sp. NBC_01796]